MTTDVLLTYGGTEEASRITVWVNGTSLGVFDTYSGGDVAAKDNKHRPGGMGNEKSYGSLPTYSDITASRVYEWTRDLELARALAPLAGRVEAHLVEQPLDPDGNAYGSPRTFLGAFRGTNLGKADSTSDSIRMWEVKIEVTSVA